MTTPPNASYGAASAALAGRREGLVSDVDRQADPGRVGRRFELLALGSRDSDGDRLARVVGRRSSGPALLGLRHAPRIRDTGTLDQPEYPCHDNRMTTTQTPSLTNHDLSNNDGLVTGMTYDADNGMWVALTRTQSRWFKTETGAARWLARWGYTPDGKRLAP